MQRSTGPRREVDWDGFVNTRDLGGLRTRDGRTTKRGAYVRSGSLRYVTTAGWDAARSAGVRTVIDLRNADEIRPMGVAGPTPHVGTAIMAPDEDESGPIAGVTRLEIDLDGIDDVEFWQRINREFLNGTPLYYLPFLDRMPHRVAAVMHALARSEGGVLFHCAGGRDRTGLISLLLLALVDVEPDEIVADYELSGPGVAALLARVGMPDQADSITAELSSRGHTIRTAVLEVLDGFDVEHYLLAAGVTAEDIAAIRSRLLG